MSPPRPRPPSTAAAAPRGRRVLAAGLLAAALAGCATVVTPPPAPLDPVEVFLLDHGRTPSLILPAADGEAVRWAYGDWRWYALGEHGVGEALAALFRPTRAGLGREGLEVPPRAPAVRAAVSVEIDSLYPIRVERRAATALAERLDGPLLVPRRDADRQPGQRPPLRAPSRALHPAPQLEPGGGGLVARAGLRGARPRDPVALEAAAAAARTAPELTDRWRPRRRPAATVGGRYASVGTGIANADRTTPLP
jgi:hypothetical protein